MHWLGRVRLDGEGAEYFSKQAVWVLLKVCRHGREHREEQVQLPLTHSLDDKLAIVAEEEETSASTRPLPGLEDLVTIRVRTQALLQDFRVCHILSKSVQEELPLMERHLNVGV